MKRAQGQVSEVGPAVPAGDAGHGRGGRSAPEVWAPEALLRAFLVGFLTKARFAGAQLVARGVDSGWSLHGVRARRVRAFLSVRSHLTLPPLQLFPAACRLGMPSLLRRSDKASTVGVNHGKSSLCIGADQAE